VGEKIIIMRTRTMTNVYPEQWDRRIRDFIFILFLKLCKCIHSIKEVIPTTVYKFLIHFYFSKRNESNKKLQ